MKVMTFIAQVSDVAPGPLVYIKLFVFFFTNKLKFNRDRKIKISAFYLLLYCDESIG